jgi:hypothetical protein
MAFFGAAPIGSLFAGAVADHFGAPAAIFAGGVACLVASLAFFRVLPDVRRAARPIYIKLGILPESAASVPPPLTAPPDG